MTDDTHRPRIPDDTAQRIKRHALRRYPERVAELADVMGQAAQPDDLPLRVYLRAIADAFDEIEREERDRFIANPGRHPKKPPTPETQKAQQARRHL